MNLIAAAMSGLIASFLFAGIGLFFGAKTFRKARGESYSPLRHFPFEMNEGNDFPCWASKACFVFFFLVLFFFGSLLLLDSSLRSAYLQTGVLLSSVSFVASSFLALLFFTPAYRFRLHLPFAVLGLGFVTIFGAAAGFAFYSFRLLFGSTAYLFMALEFAFALGNALLIINPKMRDWTRLNVMMEPDGSLTSSRPKIFVLAFSEWLAIALYFAEAITLAIGLALMA